MATDDQLTWRQEWRDQWEVQNALLALIADRLEGEEIMSALDDLTAAVANNAEVSGRVSALVDTLQDQVSALQASIDELVAAGNPDLGPVTEQIAAITAQLTAAEAPNEG